MNTHFTKRIIFATLFTMASILSFSSTAEPYLAYKNNLKCMACHVNPNGGGLRNDFGRSFGQSLLPTKAIDYDSKSIAQISPFLTFGMDARFNGIVQNDDDNTDKTFELSNAQLYLNISIPNSGLSFYLDQQVAPGTAINREAYAMYQFDPGYYFKAGKFFVPYGLRIEDDSAFIRQATGMNFDNSDNGVEFSLDYSNTTVNFYISNGTSQASNDDDDAFLYGTRIEHLFSNFRVGASLALNDGEQQTTMVNFYSGMQWHDFTFLAEADLINLEQANTFNGEDIEQLATLLEVNYQWRQGLNIKLTAEYFDPDRDVSENQQTRYSLVAEYTPISHIQLRFGLRIKDDIPQFTEQNYDLVFIQSHFYF